MRSASKIVVLVLMTISLTACWDQKIYEDIGFILQMGLEKDSQDKMMYTLTIPVIGIESKGKVEALYASNNNLLREARGKLRNVAGKTLEGGKTQHIYFSKDLAQKGISQYFELFLRNPENPLLANVIVVDGSPNDMMNKSVTFENKPIPAVYVNNLLVDARSRGVTPETRIYDFVIENYSKTIDPVTPFVTYTNNYIEVAGCALFSSDKMVGQLDINDTMLLNILMNIKRNFQYIYKEKDDPEKIKQGAAVLVKGFKRKIKVNIDKEPPNIDIDMSFNIILNEYSGPHNLENADEQKKFQQLIAMAMKKDFEKLLKHLQEIDSDPIGFGEMIRAKHSDYYKSINWKHVYKNIKFNVNVKTNLESYGAID